MPFYPALPEYKPATARPFTSLIGGVGAAQEIMGQAAKTNIMREALAQKEREREGMAAYMEGDPTKIATVAPDLYMKLNEDQRKTAAEAAEYVTQQAPFVQTPKDYATFRENFYKTHKGVNPAMLPPVERVTSPEQVQQIMNRGVQQALSVKTQAAKAESGVRLDYETKLYKAVKEPAARLEFDFRSRLLGKEYDFRKSMEQNKLEFEATQKNADRALMEKTRKDTVQANREHTVAAAYGHEQTEMMKGLDKLLLEAEKMGPEGVEQAEEARKHYTTLSNERLESFWRPFAAEMGVKLPPSMKLDKRPTGLTRPTAIRTVEQYRSLMGTEDGWKGPGMYGPRR